MLEVFFLTELRFSITLNTLPPHNSLLGVVTQDGQTSRIISLGFLQAFILINKGRLNSHPNTKALKSRTHHIKLRNLYIPLDEFQVLTVAAVLRNSPGLSHDLGVSHGKLLALECLVHNYNEVERVGL